MTRLLIARSLRAKVLLLVGFGVVAPLAIVGVWIAGATERSGRELLRGRLDGALANVITEISSRWLGVRSSLLDLAETVEVQRALSGDGRADVIHRAWKGPSSDTETDVGASEWPASLVIRGADSVVRWILTSTDDTTLRLAAAADTGSRGAGVTVSLPVTSRASGEVLGTIEARLVSSMLVPVGAGGTGGIGAVLGISDPAHNAWLAPLPFDPALLNTDEFDWAGDHWLVARRTLEEPRLLLAAAAPLSAYTAPFQSAARNGAVAFLIVSVTTLALATFLTRRFTMSLERLAIAADAVSKGDLERRADVPDDDDVGRVGRAFNSMIDSLRDTLAELARRERLAAVGEFAASLAHEVRNPLTALRMDLQRVEEQVPDEPALRVPLERALRVVTRLNHTVSGALRVARSGTGGTDLVNLSVPLQRALEVTAPAFSQAGIVLDVPVLAADPIHVRADTSALEQLFLNLLLNASQSFPSGTSGRVTVSLDAMSADAVVTIRDTGQGIPAELLPRVFDPFVSSKQEGTGLGLAIARQIAIAHGGELQLESEAGVGTSARLRLPLAETVLPAAVEDTRRA